MIEKIISKDSFFINQYRGDENQIQKHIEHLLTFDTGRRISNVGGYQSHDITFGFQDMINFAINSLSAIGENVVLSNFWVNINQGNHYNDQHIHGMGMWAGVYYHKVCCEKSTLNFHNLVPTVNKDVYSYSPKEKQMIFFKSSQPHSVSACNGQNHERISIAFNFSKL